MAAVAAFLERPNATLYAQACERFGVDPGAVFDDDFLAAQYRIAAAVLASRAPETPVAVSDAAPFDEAREAGRKLRAMT